MVRHVGVSQGQVRLGVAGRLRHGVAWRVMAKAWRGKAGEVGPGTVRPG